MMIVIFRIKFERWMMMPFYLRLPLCHLGFASMPGVNLKQILREISSQNLTRVRSGVLPLGEITKRWRNISSPMSQAVFLLFISLTIYNVWVKTRKLLVIPCRKYQKSNPPTPNKARPSENLNAIPSDRLTYIR